MAEARERHQLEQEGVRRENVLERRRLAEEERQAVAERVHTVHSAAVLFVYKMGLCNPKTLHVV